MTTAYVKGRVFNFEYSIGGTGLAGNGFFYPSDFAVGADGLLYVLSKSIEFAPAAGITCCTFEPKVLWESRGNDFLKDTGPLPSAIAVDKDRTVYVADEFNNRIYLYDEEGSYAGVWREGDQYAPAPGERIFEAQNTVNKGTPLGLYLQKVGARDTSGDGEINGAMGLVFDSEENLYVSDSHNHRIQVFKKDGTFLRKWGSYGDGPGQFNLPWGLTIDKEGFVYVADWKNSRVQKFTPDGEYVATIGGSGSGEGELDRPSGVAVDKDGDIYVVDWKAARLNIYDSEGTYLWKFLGDCERPSVWSQARIDSNLDITRARKRADISREKFFRVPVAVQVDDEGRVMVLESVGSRIQIYVKEQDWTDPPFNL